MTSCVEVVAVRMSCASAPPPGQASCTRSRTGARSKAARETFEAAFRCARPESTRSTFGAISRAHALPIDPVAPMTTAVDVAGSTPISLAPRKRLCTPAAIVSEFPVVTGIGERSLIVIPASPTTAVNAPRPATCAPSSTPISIARTTRRYTSSRGNSTSCCGKSGAATNQPSVSRPSGARTPVTCTAA